MNAHAFPVLSPVLSLAVLLAATSCGGGGSGGGDQVQPRPEPARMIADIKPGDGQTPSYPSGGATLNGLCYFSATTGEAGTELWVTDGTEAGTRMFLDILPGSMSSQPGQLTTLNGLIYFSATTASGRELWATDGTVAGTAQVADIHAGPGSSSPAGPVVVSSYLVFTADDGIQGRELWRADGRTVSLIRDINPGAPDSSPREITPFLGGFLFAATTSTAGQELWISDGTSGGTSLLADIRPGAGGSSLSQITVLADRAVFRANRPGSGIEAWVTDGSVGGTTVLADLNPGSGSSHASLFTRVGAKIYFTATVSGATQICQTDGTPTGTAQIAGVTPGPTSNLMAFGDKLFFAAVEPTGAHVGYVTDGTVAGTVRLPDFGGTEAPQGLGVIRGNLVYRGDSAAHGQELFLTDGTVAGTRLLADLATTPTADESSLPFRVGALGDTLLVRADDGIHGNELFFVDEFGARLANLAPEIGEDSSPSGFQSFAGDIYFTARGPDGGELYRTVQESGVIIGATQVADLRPGPDSSNPRNLTVVADRLVFVATTDATGSELALSDGTGAGTQILDLNPGTATSSPTPGCVLGDRLLFSAKVDGFGEELWVTDGTAAGTVLVRDLAPGPSSSRPRDFALLGDHVYFAATVPGLGTPLFRTDGTPSGTVPVTESISSGPRTISTIAATTASVYFVATTQPTGRSLFVAIDESPGFRELLRLPADGYIFELVAMGDALIFVIQQESRSQLWLQTKSEQEMLVELDRISNLTVVGDRVYFGGQTASLGREPWATDGTVSGTRLLADVYAGPLSSWPRLFTEFQGEVWFSARDELSGREMRKLTADNTVELVADGFPGPASGLHLTFDVLATDVGLFTSVRTPENGSEPWCFHGKAPE